MAWQPGSPRASLPARLHAREVVRLRDVLRVVVGHDAAAVLGPESYERFADAAQRDVDAVLVLIDPDAMALLVRARHDGCLLEVGLDGGLDVGGHLLGRARLARPEDPAGD